MARILIAESDPDGGLLLVRALRIAGHEVHLASDAITATSIAITNAAEIVVLSTTLPKGRASEVVRQVRAAGIWPRRIIGLKRHGGRTTDLPEAAAWLSWPLAPEDLQVIDEQR